MGDFDVFISAAKIIFSGAIPYGEVGFFAPPWASIFIFPFVLIPKPFSMYAWQFASIAAIVVTCIITNPKGRLFPLMVIFSPPSLHLLIVGQLSAFVALASTGLLLEVANKRRTWILIVCSFIALSKPHLALLPIAMMLFTLLRKREFQKVIYVIGFFIGLVLLFELLFPTCMLQWLEAMFSGNYKGEYESTLHHVLLVNGATISIGYGCFRGSMILFLPVFVMYLYYYFRESLTPRVIALTLSIMLLILPYFRLYDFVMLIYPVGILFSRTIYEVDEHNIVNKPTKWLRHQTRRVRVEI